MTELSRAQEDVLAQVLRWHQSASPDVFRLFGYAGTGKTTLARQFASGIEGSVLYAAYTGKAATVMQQAGCLGATTIHRLLYRPQMRSRKQLRELQRLLLTANDPDEIADLSQRVDEETQRLREPSFTINDDSAIKVASLVVVDECSMVDQRTGADLLSFGTPVLALGDPAQLPPVRGVGYFSPDNPDAMLTEIHRQAADSPVIQIATAARERRPIELGDWGNGTSVIPRSDLKVRHLLDHDQVLVGTNALRNQLNRQIREALGYESPLPVAGDRLVCLKNNHDMGIYNGSIWTVFESMVVDEDTMRLGISSEDRGDMYVQAHRHHFEGRENEVSPWDTESLSFNFGYALTAHKSQGSQWDSVLVVDESNIFRGNAARWLYTAVTRARKRLTLVR